MDERPVFTLLIVIITTVVTIIAFRNKRVAYALVLNTDAVVEHQQYYRLFTSSLVHADFGHIVLNMYALYSFGEFFEYVYSGWQLLLIYVLSVIVGSFAGLIIHRRDYRYTALGASGGVYGVIGAVTAAHPDLRMLGGIPAWVMTLVILGYSVYVTRKGGDGIGHDAHLGGMVAGITLFGAFYPEIIAQNIAIVALLMAASAATWLMLLKYRR